MKYLFTLCLLVFTLSASAQWQQTGSKVRYVNGLGIPTRDTVAGVLADSSQILIRPADSSLYVKYKRTWLRVGGGGGSIAGSGTTNYIPKFTSSTAIGNSSIFDNGNVGIGTTSPIGKLSIVGTSTGVLDFNTDATRCDIQSYNKPLAINRQGNNTLLNEGGGNVGIGTASPAYKLDVNGAILSTTSLYKNSAGTNVLNVAADDQQYGGSSSDGGIFVYGNNKLFLSTNSTRQVTITGGGDVGIGTTSPVGRLNISSASGDQIRIDRTSQTARAIVVSGTDQLSFGTWTSATQMNLTTGGNLLLNTTTDNGTDRLQVSGSMNVSTLATTNNLSVTTNATIGGTLRVTGTTTLGTTNTGAINATSIDAASGNGTFGNIYSNGLVQMLGVNVKYRNISATYTATTGDDYFINITSGTFTLNLPTAVTPYGQVYVIKNSGTGTVTVDPNGTQTIDGATTFTMNVQNQSITIIGDGSNWKIVSKYL